MFEQNRDPPDQTLSWRISWVGYRDLMWLFMWKLAIISCSVGFRAGNGRKGTKIIACRRQSRDVTDRYTYIFNILKLIIIFLFICRIYLFILYIYLIHLFYYLFIIVRRPPSASTVRFCVLQTPVSRSSTFFKIWFILQTPVSRFKCILKICFKIHKGCSSRELRISSTDPKFRTLSTSIASAKHSPKKLNDKWTLKWHF